MNHPPIPPKSELFIQNTLDEEQWYFQYPNTVCGIQGHSAVSVDDPRWRTIIAAVAAEEWNRRAEAQIEDAFLSLTALHNREEWREWGRAKP